MTSPNGRLTEAELVHVSAVETLSVLTARAYRHLVIAGHAAGIKVSLASPGAAYRSFEVQDEMRRGSLGDRALAAKWGLNPNSSVPLASAGYSTHGTGTRVDLLFNGSSWPTTAELALAAHYGFTREFGADDPNHFRHDGRTAIQPLSDAQVAAAHLYPHEDGKPSPKPASSAPGAAFASPHYHVVKSGETVGAMAAYYGTSVAAITAWNHLADPNRISVGQRLRVR